MTSGVSGLFNLLSLACSILTLLIFVRILVTWIPGVSSYNPVIRILVRVVDPVLAPFRRLLPRFGPMDLSPILAIVVIGALGNVFRVAAEDTGVLGATISPLGVIVDIIAQLVLTLITIVCVIVLIRVVLSLFHADPWHPATMTIREVSSLFVRPFTGVAPQSAGVDTAAVIAFVAYLVLYFLAKAALTALEVHFPIVTLG